MTRASTALGFAVLLVSAVSLAGQITIRPATVEAGEAVEIEVSVEGSFAKLDSIELPVRNLRIDGPPSVSSEFQWINGVVSRRKRFRYSAHALTAGAASAGPLTLVDEQGRRTVLPAATLEVIPEAESTASTPSELLDDLQRAGKEKIFIFGELDRTRAWEGQQVIATWYLYTAEPVRDLDLGEKPGLQDFWVEELPIGNQEPEQVSVGGTPMRRIAIRRVALFPLRSGTLQIGRFEAIAQVVEPMENPIGGLSILEGSVENVRRKAPEMTVDVQPLPAGARIDAVGTFGLACASPVVPQQGPVSIEVTVSGSGNLRGARPPHFTGPVEASTDIQDAGFKVSRSGPLVTMERRWKILLFPLRDGVLRIPPLAFDLFNPSAGETKTALCPGVAVAVHRATAPGQPAGANRSERSGIARSPRDLRPWMGGAAIVALLGLITVLAFRSRRRFDRAALRHLLAAKDDPQELRKRLYWIVEGRGLTPAALLEERSDRGEAFRALSSWIEIRARETMTGEASERELRERAVGFLQVIADGARR